MPGGGGWDCWIGGGGGRLGWFATSSLGGGPGGGGGKGGGGNDVGTLAVAGLGGIGGGGGKGNDAGNAEPSTELTLLVSGKGGGGGGGGGGGTANTSSSDSVFEADAAVLDEEPDNGIRGPAVQQKGRLNKSFMSWQTKIVLDPCFFQTIMNRP